MFTKENIIIAFWEIYREKSINKITIKELMDKAGYHRSVFYTYFKDIYDLLEQEQEDFFVQIDKFLPYILNCFFFNQEDKHTLQKLKAFFLMYAPKLYVLLGEHGDMSFQFKLKEKIRKNIYKFFHLDKNDLKAELAVEFFINGHLNALLYMYKYKDRLSIEDYLEIVRPVINNIFVLKNRQ